MDLPVGSYADLSSEVVEPQVRSSEVIVKGRIFDLRRDVVDLGEHGEVTREYLDHPGAVVIVALREIDGVDHVVMIRQYRHPVRTREWELPAGLLDVHGEAPALSAARELAEEVELKAERWDVVIDFFASPGSTSETLRVFLARDISTRHRRDVRAHRRGGRHHRAVGAARRRLRRGPHRPDPQPRRGHRPHGHLGRAAAGVVDAAAGRRTLALVCRRLSPRRTSGSASASPRTTAPSTSASRSGRSSTSSVPTDELVVVDDASTDDTVSIVESFGDPRITVHRNDANVGSVRTFERALGLARGAYLSSPTRTTSGCPAASRRWSRRSTSTGSSRPASRCSGTRRTAALAAAGTGLAPVCGERRRGPRGGALVLRLRDGAAPRPAPGRAAVPALADRVARPVDRPGRQRGARDAAPRGAPRWSGGCTARTRRRCGWRSLPTILRARVMLARCLVEARRRARRP